MRLESYAQELEDVLIYSVLRDIPNGFYIDVGANDPTNINVTKFFYERGWHGINVEPLQSRCILLEEQRPRDINLCIGLGSKRDKLAMFGEDEGATFSKEIATRGTYANNSDENTKTILTLTEVFHKYCEPRQQIHFCKIDVEGYEKEVLEGIKDWDEFRPWLFVIESTLPGTYIPCHEQWEHILIENDYLFAFKNGINRYYIDKQKEHLMQRVNEISTFLERYEIGIMRMQIVKVH